MCDVKVFLTFPFVVEIRIFATGPCIANQLRDVNTIYAGEAGILLHIFGKFMILKLKLSRLS
jgi:hypothetical protein